MKQPYEVFSESIVKSYFDCEGKSWSSVEGDGIIGFSCFHKDSPNCHRGFIPVVHGESVQERHERFLKYLADKEQVHAGL